MEICQSSIRRRMLCVAYCPVYEGKRYDMGRAGLWLASNLLLISLASRPVRPILCAIPQHQSTILHPYPVTKDSRYYLQGSNRSGVDISHQI